MSPQDPSPPPGEQPTVDMPGPATGQSRPLWFVPALLTVAVLAVAGVAVAAVMMVSSGGTAQADEVVPADTLAFATLDLNPSAGQKIDAARFLRKFPQLRDQVAGGDLRRSLVQALLESDEDLSGIRYERDIEPWLGQRLAVAAVPPPGGGDKPEIVVALQVTDEDAAREGIRKLDEASHKGSSAAAFFEGYALVAENQKTADRVVAAAQRSPLVDDRQYRADMADLGETGVSFGWADLDAIGDAVGDAKPQAVTGLGGQGLTGRVTYALRFTGDDVELAANAVGLEGVREFSGQGDVGLAQLPTSTVFALGVANGDQQFPYGWDQLLSQIQGTPAEPQFEQLIAQVEASGFRLPDDLATLFGSSLAFAVDGEGLDGPVPRLGARSVTDPDEANRILDQVEALVGPAFGRAVTRKTLGNGVVVATDPTYADELSSDGGLGSEPGFAAALPDVEDADVAAWVSLLELEPLLTAETSDQDARQALAALDSVGLSMTADGEGEATYRLRVITR